MLKIAKNSSYRHKIELSLRFSGKNTYFKQLFRHFLFLFYICDFTCEKTLFMAVQKKFCAKIFWDSLYMYKGVLCKKTLLEKPELF